MNNLIAQHKTNWTKTFWATSIGTFDLNNENKNIYSVSSTYWHRLGRHKSSELLGQIKNYFYIFSCKLNILYSTIEHTHTHTQMSMFAKSGRKFVKIRMSFILTGYLPDIFNHQTWANNSTGNRYSSKTRQKANSLVMNRWQI